MGTVASRTVAGHTVYYDSNLNHQNRIVDIIGPDVVRWELAQKDLQQSGGTGTDPTGYVTTVVEVGAGTSEFANSATPGIVGRITCAANENDGLQIQLYGEQFEFTSNQSLVYFGCEVAINDADQTDILVGLCITDTTLLGGLSDGVYLESLDGGATVSSVTEKDSTETQADSIGTLTDSGFHTLEFFFDGSTVFFYFDGVQSATTHASNIPDDEALTPSIAFLTGEAVANTVDFRWARAFMIGRT